MRTQTVQAKLPSDITAESNAKEASVNKPSERQAVKEALASVIAFVLISLGKISTSQSLFSSSPNTEMHPVFCCVPDAVRVLCKSAEDFLV